jgi:hypothetical protein
VLVRGTPNKPCLHANEFGSTLTPTNAPSQIRCTLATGFSLPLSAGTRENPRPT